MSIAYCLIRAQPCYRRDSFIAGLEAVGRQVILHEPAAYGPDDVLIVWNLYGRFGAAAARCQAAGGRVLVCENGYLGEDGEGRQYYAIAEGGHNGAGQWKIGTRARWDLLGIDLKPWRPANDAGAGHVLVCAQRGIGSASMASPPGWHDDVAGRLRRLIDRPVRIRRHPGDRQQPPPANGPSMADDLVGAWAVVVWSSNCANQALVAGVPAFFEAPHHVAEPAVVRGIDGLADPPLGDRLAGLVALSWAQWSVAEIAAGAPFRNFGL